MRVQKKSQEINQKSAHIVIQTRSSLFIIYIKTPIALSLQTTFRFTQKIVHSQRTI